MMYPFAISFDGRENPREAVAHVAVSQPRVLPMPVNVIFRAPATIVFWDDGDKTVVKCQPGDTYCAETGLCMAMLKKYMGNDNTFNRVIGKWLERAQYVNTPALPEAAE